ncbi:MAG: hypothetical protein L0216_17725 [Planctomycetales bacterium]|nr:hypothetical protein [Planctomycetales bacterium]
MTPPVPPADPPKGGSPADRPAWPPATFADTPSVPPVRPAGSAAGETKSRAKEAAPPAPPAPRAGKGDAPAGDLAETLEKVQEGLAEAFQDHRQKVLEYKVLVSEGLRQSVGALDLQSEKIVELLKANQELVRGTVASAQQIAKHDERQRELEADVKELRARADELAQRARALAEEKGQLQGTLKRGTEEQARATDQNRSLRDQIEKLEKDQDALGRENQKLEKQRDKLQGDVERLSKLREEYLANIAKYREKKEDLTAS